MAICKRCHGSGFLLRVTREQGRSSIKEWYKKCTDCGGAGTKPRPLPESLQRKPLEKFTAGEQAVFRKPYLLSKNQLFMVEKAKQELGASESKENPVLQVLFAFDTEELFGKEAKCLQYSQVLIVQFSLRPHGKEIPIPNSIVIKCLP